MKIEDQTALVTGANRGIGRAICEALLGAGAKRLYAGVRKPGSAEALVEAGGGRVREVELDVTRPEAADACAKEAADLTLLVNNAGILTHTSVLDPGAEATLRREMEVNLYGPLRLARAFAPILRKNGGGGIVNLNSVVSLTPMDMIGTYSLSKAASFSLTCALREALEGTGLHVLSVHPGPIDTGMTAEIDMEKARPEEVAERIVKALRDDQTILFPDPFAENLWDNYQTHTAEVLGG